MGDKAKLALSAFEWLTIVFILASTGVSVAAYAFTHFETRQDAVERELRLNDGIKELRVNQEQFMKNMGYAYKHLPPSTP